MPYYPQSPEFNPLPDQVTDAMLSNMPDGTVKGREIGAGAGDPTNIGRALSYRNILGRNGGCEVWQRGAGDSPAFEVVSSSIVYTSDGWFLATGPNQHHSVYAGAGLSSGSRRSLLVVRDVGETGTGPVVLEFPLDTDEIIPARGQIVTLSFMSLKDAAWTAPDSMLTAAVIFGTGAPIKRATSSFTSETVVLTTAATVATSAARHTATATVMVPLDATQGCVQFYWGPLGTAPASDYFAIDDVQLEIGTQATPFERRPFEQELLACQRHYYKTFRYDAAPASGLGDDHAYQTWPSPVGPSALSINPGLRFPQIMRAAPTIAGFNPMAAGGQVRDLWAAQDCTGSSAVSSSQQMIVAYTTPAGTVAGNSLGIHIVADAGI